MEHPNATWNDFCTHSFQKGVCLQGSSNFLNDEATLGQAVKTFLGELKKHRINAVQATFKSVDPNKKEEEQTRQDSGSRVLVMDTPLAGAFTKLKMRN